MRVQSQCTPTGRWEARTGESPIRTLGGSWTGTRYSEQQETLCPPDRRRGPTLEVLCPSMWWGDGGSVWGFLLRIGPVYPGQSHTTCGERADSGGCPFDVAPALLPAI